MAKYRQRPKGTYIEEANWEELYRLTKLWKTDIEFYRDDSKFLHHLMDKYFIWILTKDSKKFIGALQLNLKNLDTKCRDLLVKIDKHLTQLAALVEYPDTPEGRLFRLEHAHLEEEVHDFTTFFRGNRMAVFNAVEGAVLNEKVKHLLSDIVENKV
jgi:hypothetical protein